MTGLETFRGPAGADDRLVSHPGPPLAAASAGAARIRTGMRAAAAAADG